MSKPCKYCGEEITWDKSASVFTNTDGSKHDCRTQKLDKPASSIEESIRAIVRDEIKKVKG